MKKSVSELREELEREEVAYRLFREKGGEGLRSPLWEEKISGIHKKIQEAEEREELEHRRHVVELLRAEEQGKLLILPCAVGTTVYIVYRTCEGMPTECRPCPYFPDIKCRDCEERQWRYNSEKLESVSRIVDLMDAFGDTVFLTEEEALHRVDQLEKLQ